MMVFQRLDWHCKFVRISGDLEDVGTVHSFSCSPDPYAPKSIAISTMIARLPVLRGASQKKYNLLHDGPSDAM